MRSAKAMGWLADALPLARTLVVSGLLAGLVSGCQANDSQRGFGYGGGYGGYPGGYGGYPGGYGGYPGGYGGGYRSRGGYRSYDRYPGASGSYGRGYRANDGYRHRAPSPGRPPAAQGGRPPLVGPDGRINPGGYR